MLSLGLQIALSWTWSGIGEGTQSPSGTPFPNTPLSHPLRLNYIANQKFSASTNLVICQIGKPVVWCTGLRKGEILKLDGIDMFLLL